MSVVIATTGNRESLRAAVTSVLASVDVDVELIVVDQSSGSGFDLRELATDRRLHHVVTSVRGVSAARNVGIAMAANDLVLVIDDDVTVDRRWAVDFATALDGMPRVAVAFCQVVAAPHDRMAGFVPDHVVDRPCTIRSIARKASIDGIGAGMAVRRHAVLSFGAFDEMLGPGAPFRASEDRDIATRALLNGWWVHSTDAATVVHHGFRTWEEGRALTRRDWYGIGATYAKQIKSFDVRIIPVLAVEVLQRGLLLPLWRTLHGHPPHGLQQLGFCLLGLIAGLRTPLNMRSMVYRDVDAPIPGAQGVVDVELVGAGDRPTDHGSGPAVTVARCDGVPVGSATVPRGQPVDVDGPLSWRTGGVLAPPAATPATITVAVCTRNRADLLGRCLASIGAAVVATGGEATVEILVVDNASDDEQSIAVAERCGARAVAEPVPGLDVARNRAVAECTTDLIVFVDDDVVVDRWWLRTLVRTFAANPQAVAVTGGVLALVVDTPARFDFERGGGFSKGWEAGRVDPLVRVGSPFDPSIGVGCNMAFRRAALAEIGPFDEALDTGPPLPGGGDLDMLIRAAMHGEAWYEPSAVVFHEHRRTWRELDRQYRSWGTSWGALLHKWYAMAPEQRPAVRRSAGQALRFYGHDLLAGPRDGRRRRRHAVELLTGFAGGVTVAYPRSRRRMAARRSAVEGTERPSRRTLSCERT